VLYIYDNGIIDICSVLVWNFVSCIRRIKSVQKQIEKKKKKKKKKKRYIEAVFKPPQ
jgi:nitrogen fixation/metabolism regulation signal transduction histidine kinase